MKIKLTQLTLENFKGIRNFTLEPGDTCLIRGANAAGKTTIMDGFLWLLFGKDSEGKADFALKTLKAGREIPNLEHTVEGIFEVDDTTLTLKKVLKEKYTKKRGASRADFTGHTTDYYIDAVPVQKKEWDQQIANIIDEETFKLLTSPTYFNSLHWEKRRSILLEVCGDISDSDIIASDKSLAGLTEILGNNSVKNQKKVIKATQVEINERLTEIPSRIDELDKSLADVSGYDIKAIRTEIKGIDDQIQAMNDDTIRSNLRKQKAELEAKLSELETDKEIRAEQARRKIGSKTEALENDLRIKKAYITDSWDQIVRKESTVKDNEHKMSVLRVDYASISGRKADVKDSCPTCGQALPEDQVQDAIKKHNQGQADHLAGINSDGKLLKNETARLTEEVEAATKKVRTDEKDVKTLESEITGLKAAPAPDSPFDTSSIDKIKAELQDINKRLVDNLPPDTGPLEVLRKTLQAKIAEIDAAKRTRARIEELKDEEKMLAAEYEEFERQISLLEKFITSKVGMLEEKINSRFSLVKWKLFEVQINEGISETCIAMVDGVPHSSLNDGHRIFAGCDIISTFQKHYDVKAPVFIDHYEALSSPIKMDCQTIFLEVSKDKELKVLNE